MGLPSASLTGLLLIVVSHPPSAVKITAPSFTPFLSKLTVICSGRLPSLSLSFHTFLMVISNVSGCPPLTLSARAAAGKSASTISRQSTLLRIRCPFPLCNFMLFPPLFVASYRQHSQYMLRPPTHGMQRSNGSPCLHPKTGRK